MNNRRLVQLHLFGAGFFLLGAIYLIVVVQENTFPGHLGWLKIYMVAVSAFFSLRAYKVSKGSDE